MHSVYAEIGQVVDKIRLPITSSSKNYESNQKARETILRLKRQQLPSAAELYLSSLRVSMELLWDGHTHHRHIMRNCVALLKRFKKQSTKARDDTKKLIDNGRFDEEGKLQSFVDSVRLAEHLMQKKFCQKMVDRGKHYTPERYSAHLFFDIPGYACACACAHADTSHPANLQSRG